MNQDEIFSDGEGDRWYQRNKAALDGKSSVDWPLFLFDLLECKNDINSVAEIGCSNGYRLEKIRMKLTHGCRCVGLDASRDAIQDGKLRYPELDLNYGLLSDLPINEEFKLVIINFVLHWVDRKTLMKSMAEIDRLTQDGGFVVIGDFLPDYQQRRRYHHLPDAAVYTYKQDYSKILLSAGTYKELARFTFNHDVHSRVSLAPSESSVRGVCTILHKSLQGYYAET